MSKRTLYSLITVAILLVVWFWPVPAGLKLQAWHLFAIFLATVVGFILGPFSNGVIALTSLVIAIFTNTLTISQVLTGAFGGTTVWLVVSAFLFAKGFAKTGLGRRIAFVITRSCGGSSLTLAYSLAASDLVLGPFTPSNTARAGGVLFPIVNSICEAFDSRPGATAKRIGTFLMSTVFHSDIVVSAMFLTSMAANPLAAELAKKTLGIDISWGTWFLAAAVPGIIGLIVIPLVMYMLCPPELKSTPEAKQLAARELIEMGPMSGKEKIMMVVFLIALCLWATSQFTNLDATAVAFLGIVIMLIFDVITWDDVIKEHKAWDTLIWMGSVVCIASFLNSTGFITWFANAVSASLQGIGWMAALLVAFLVYLYSHYGFASMTAHVTAMYAALVAVAAAAGAPAFMAAFSVAIAANVCGCLTHYGTGPAPIYFGAGYIDQQTWWRNGFILSLIHTFIWMGIGSAWWKILGLW
jgi:DASS family divalent anion:Na+ symporter